MTGEDIVKTAKERPALLASWLFACCGLVFAMVVVGAVTRLTDSGLSITEWRPLTGALPPMSEAEWERLFALYRQSPEFEKKHFWMGLADFKAIFFWEWFHRLLGRLIGLAYLLPFLWFWVQGMIPQGYKLKLLGIFLLGGAQGALGWFMVQSGLIDNPAVSHYRLAAHLGLAFLIYGLMLWSGLSMIRRDPRQPDPALYAHGWLALGLLAITIFWGAYTAGLDAGMIYNETFPKMGGRWIPKEIYQYDPFWISFFESHVGVQFAHRWLAMATVVMMLSLWGHALRRKSMSPVFHALGLMVLAQMGLGIATLLSGVFLPLAVAHQAGALILLTLLICALHGVRPGSRSYAAAARLKTGVTAGGGSAAGAGSSGTAGGSRPVSSGG